ncbi:MAG TPA: SOS response-associated peptidase family protein, partial [Terriglobales bacterium]
MSESWAEFYQLALIELDSSQMNRRISEARSAILTRLKALPEDATEESQTIADALNSLRLLEREIKSGREEIATMCGRFRQTRSSKILASHFNFELIDALNEFDILPRINIAPTQEVVVIKQDQKKARTITGMRWGLIPVWAKDASVGNRNINARSEGLRETASFRDLIAS